MNRKISGIKGHVTEKLPAGSEKLQIASSALFADAKQTMAAAASASRMAREPDEEDEGATGNEMTANPAESVADSLDIGSDKPLLLAQADPSNAGSVGTGAAAAQSSPYSAGPPPWLWVAGGLGAAAAGGAILAASSGSDGAAVSPPLPVNAAPVFISGTTGSVDEHTAVSTVIYDAAASDPEGAAVTYSLGGADASLLNIISATGEVTLKAPADYESKASYSFSVIASDGTNSAEQAVTVSVVNVNEHVVVEQTGAYIDLNGNGIQDSDDTAVAAFSVGGNADLTTNAVTIEFNSLPATPINLSGFGMDDKIEIDVQAFVDNGHIGIAPLADPAAITLDQFTAYTQITADGLHQAYFTLDSLEIYDLGRTVTPFTSFGVWLSNMSLLKYQSGASATLASFATLNLTGGFPLQSMVNFIIPPEAT